MYYKQQNDQSLEGPPDGFTFFGTLADIVENEYDEDEMKPSRDSDEQQQNYIVVNDFVIPSRNAQSAEQHRGRHFQIWFDPTATSLGYYIKDLGIGFGVFKKMDNHDTGLLGPESQSQIQAGKVVLKDNMLINVGEAYIVVNLYPEGIDEDEAHHTLRLKIFGGTNNGEVYEFNINEMQGGQRTIYLGRTPECDIKINDKLLSKTQSHIKVEHTGNP